MLLALSVAPLAASQRGIAGIMNVPMKNKVVGIAVTPNIQRHPTCPFHEFKMSAALAAGGTGFAISQFTSCANKIPMTTVSWLMETSLPRNNAGETSAMYIGERLDARPIASPPAILHVTKTTKVFERAVPIEESVNNIADKRSMGFRPNLSVRTPDSMAPSRQPTRAQPIAHPCCPGSYKPKNFSQKGLAPPITTQS